jgi:hypothetical protein
MLGYVMAQGRGAADKLLADLADNLAARGWPLAGVVQLNLERRPDRLCDMELRVLGHDHMVRISQDLGPQARGCRLDPTGLEHAVGLVEAALDTRPALLIINKFGKSEAEGRGFRAVIGRALAEDIPVLTAVSTGNLAGFEAFSAGLGTPIEPDRASLLAWVEETCAARLG